MWLGAVLAATPVAAQSQTSNATISVNVGTLANLTVSSTSVSFPDADPDAVPQVNALGGPLTIATKARATRGSQVLCASQMRGNVARTFSCRRALDECDTCWFPAPPVTT